MGKIRRLGEKSIREGKLSVTRIQPQRSIERRVTFEIPLVGPSDDTRHRLFGFRRSYIAERLLEYSPVGGLGVPRIIARLCTLRRMCELT